MSDIPFISELYTATTGFDMNPKELKVTGDRVNTMERLLNIREGFTRKDHGVPALWLQHTEKPMKLDVDYYATDWFGRRVTREDMYQWVDDYYDESGYDVKVGVPTREKLGQLGLEEFAEIVKPYLT